MPRPQRLNDNKGHIVPKGSDNVRHLITIDRLHAIIYFCIVATDY